MNVFLDTSSLFKLYHIEDDTVSLETFFARHEVRKVYLSEITKAEFCSAAFRKLRTQEITDVQAADIVESFEADHHQYIFIPLENEILELAVTLIKKHKNVGLRTLDSFQLASLLMIKNSIDVAITADKTLLKILGFEGIKTN